MGNKKNKRVSKLRMRTNRIKNLRAVIEATRAKKNMKTSLDPIIGSADIQHVTIKNNMECENNKEVKNHIDEDTTRENDLVLKLEETEDIIESDGTKRSECESGSDVPQETQPNEEMWVVRRQLCRGCHSDGAFWSLETTTEGVAYGDLLQTYCNIQLCPVSWDEHALSAICALCAARLREARAFSAQARAAEEHFTNLYKQNRVRALVSAVVTEEVDVPEIVNKVDDLEISDDDVPDTTANSDVDDPQASNEILRKLLCAKPAPKEFIFKLSPSDYQRIGKSFKCTHCNKIFCYRAGIHNHVKNVHLESLSCPHCDKTFKKLSDFNCHKNIDHTFIYKQKSRKVYALKPSDFEHVGKSFKCTRCDKHFRDCSEVHHHVTHTHIKLPRHTCTHCDKTFHSLSPFNKHKMEEHLIDTRTKCSACNWFTYGSISKLRIHMNVFHKLGKKLSCPDCDYVCFSQQQMRKHAVRHSTVKKYHCKYCKKSFLRKNTLCQHEKIHTGDKQKVCHVCGLAFVQRASLKYHMAKHHPEVTL